MDTVTICSMQDVTIQEGTECVVKDLQLDIRESTVTVLLAEDNSASYVLQVIGGFRNAGQGAVVYPGVISEGSVPPAGWVQYVPDDIICYSNMKVKDFLCGIALSSSMEIIREGVRLCGVFGINPEEELLDLTFEQNRLVAMIQALIRRPKLLLLDRPYDMLGKRAYLLLWKEIMELRKQGTTVVLSAQSYEDVKIACDRYLFLKDGTVYKDSTRKELPRPAKVITIEGGSIDAMNPKKLQLLYQDRRRCRFLYRESNMGEMVLRIYKTGCHNFNVEELSMEEEIFADYERWMQ